MNSNRLATSYILCAVWLFGLGGLHRLYNGKIGTGLLWLFTFGLFGLGQFVDVFLLPGMVEEHELKLRSGTGASLFDLPLGQPALTTKAVALTQNQLMVKLVKAAQARGGKLTVTQAVMETGAGFAEIEAVFREMLKSGYVSVGNDSATGAVTYRFNEL